MKQDKENQTNWIGQIWNCNTCVRTFRFDKLKSKDFDMVDPLNPKINCPNCRSQDLNLTNMRTIK